MCQNIGHVIWYLTTNVKEIASSETLAPTQSYAPENCNLDANHCKKKDRPHVVVLCWCLTWISNCLQDQWKVLFCIP